MLVGLVENKTVVQYLGDFTPHEVDVMALDRRVVGSTRQDGTVYNHGMLGTNIITNKLTRTVKHGTDDIRLHFAVEKQRQPDRDYAPYVRSSWGRLVNADEGSVGNLLPDYDDFEKEINLLTSCYNVTMPAAELIPYVKQALRLVLSGSNDTAIMHVIADSLIDDFWADTLPIDLELSESTQRSKTGDLTEHDIRRKAEFDAHIVWLSGLAQKLVQYAIKISME